MWVGGWVGGCGSGGGGERRREDRAEGGEGGEQVGVIARAPLLLGQSSLLLSLSLGGLRVLDGLLLLLLLLLLLEHALQLDEELVLLLL